jgi:hypothetical protein
MPTKPPNFPMKFKVFIRWMYPGPRQHVKRLYHFRRYLCDHFKAVEEQERAPFISEEMRALSASQRADAFIERLKSDSIRSPFDPVDFFAMLRTIQDWRKQRLIDQRKEARASRTLKENRKKF